MSGSTVRVTNLCVNEVARSASNRMIVQSSVSTSVLNLPEQFFRCLHLPARLVGLQKRGVVAEGGWGAGVRVGAGAARAAASADPHQV